MRYLKADDIHALVWDSDRGKILLAARRSGNLSRQVLRQKLGEQGIEVGVTYLQKLETGRLGSIEPIVIAAICSALELDLKHFYSWVEVAEIYPRGVDDGEATQ